MDVEVIGGEFTFVTLFYCRLSLHNLSFLFQILDRTRSNIFAPG